MSDLNYTEDELLANASPDVLALYREKMRIANNGPGAPGPCKATVRRKRGQGTEANPAPATKYHAQRTEYNGKWYPSKHEAYVAEWLYLAVKGGRYDAIIEQVPFRLPGKTETGRPYIHRVDFAALKAGHVVAWFEAKRKAYRKTGKPFNPDLALGRMKRKQVEQLYGIKIEVV